jgi:integrase
MADYSVFERKGTCNYWVRFSIRGEGQIRKSLDTADSAEAERRAAKMWHEAVYRHEQGLKALKTTFRSVAEEFIAHIQQLSDAGEKRQDRGSRTRSIVRRYFIEFFGDKPIDAITDADCNRYLEWRKTYWTTGPGTQVEFLEYERNGRKLRRPVTDLKRGSSLSTQRSEAVVLRQLFRQAIRWGYIGKGQAPEIKLAKAQPSPRPSFTLNEMHALLKLSGRRAYDPKVNEKVRRDRQWLHNYVQLAAMTGMRPTELRNLTWADVLDYEEGRNKRYVDRDIRIRARGKAKHRVFIPLIEAVAVFDALRNLHGSPKPSDPVFLGKKLNKSLNALLDAAGLATDHRGIKRDSYSFRHFYISEQLRAGVDVFALARNCGTSPDMIDKHYGQVRIEQFKDHLRPQWKSAA